MEDFLRNATIQAQGHPGIKQNFADDDNYAEDDDLSSNSQGVNVPNGQRGDIVSGLSSFNPLEDNPTIKKKQIKFRYELDARSLFCAVIAFAIIVFMSIYFSYQAGAAHALSSESAISSDDVVMKKGVSETTDNSNGDSATTSLKLELDQCQANLNALQTAPNAAANAMQAVDSNGVVNLNLATLEDLQKLKGVGPSTAQKILDYRTQNGAFKSIEELKEVKGIGDATFEKLKDKIKVK